MPPSENRNTTVLVIELGPGHVYVKVAEPRPEPQRVGTLLRKTIDAWFSCRPDFVVDAMRPVSEAGAAVGVHVWYHAAENPTMPSPAASAKELVPWTIEVSKQVISQWPKERVEAIVDEAFGVWNESEARQGSLVVVSAWRLAVILDERARRGTVVPIDALGSALDGRTRQALMNWLRSPHTRLFGIPIPGSWFARQAFVGAELRIWDPSPVVTNMVYDTGPRPKP